MDYVSSRFVVFDQYWNYKSYTASPYNQPFCIICVGGYFYVAGDLHVYRTNSNFVIQNPSYSSSHNYRQMTYYSSQFYAATYSATTIQVFDTSINLVQTISLGSLHSYGLSNFNGSFYAGSTAGQLFVLQSGTVTKLYTSVSGCSGQMVSITLDSESNIAISCEANYKVVLYDNNGNYLNSYFTTSGSPYLTVCHLYIGLDRFE